MHRIAAVLNLLTQLNKLSSNNFIRHECQNGILGGCFFILFDGYCEKQSQKVQWTELHFLRKESEWLHERDYGN